MVNESKTPAEHTLNSDRLHRSSSNKNQLDHQSGARKSSLLESSWSRSSVRRKRLLLQSLNAQAISEFIQNLAQFGAQRNAMGHPLVVKLRRALSRQPDFIDAR
jgi:hypothetical protein